MSLNAWIKGRVLAFDAVARPWAARGRVRGWAYEFLLFGLKQAWACLFGGALLALLVATRLWWPPEAPLARYDLLVVCALALQVLLLATRLERWDEALVILVFHVVGTAMEVFKTAQGSWIYPEASVLRIGGVPLFSGFMYAAVGSYIARIWRLMEFRFESYPPLWAPWLLALAAYINFFTHHYVIDVRNALFVVAVMLFAPTWCVFTPDRTPRRMPLLVGFVLVALFIWIAENVGTFAAAWTYPGQAHAWRPVSPGKLGAWFLLMLLSFVLVSVAHRPRPPGQGARTNPLLAPAEILATHRAGRYRGGPRGRGVHEASDHASTRVAGGGRGGAGPGRSSAGGWCGQGARSEGLGDRQGRCGGAGIRSGQAGPGAPGAEG